MSYRHGIYVFEEPTSIIPTVKNESAMPVFFVTAPVHLSADPYNITNIPKLCYTYKEAVEAFGMSLRPEIWNNYTACQAIYSQLVLYAASPVVIINVLNPKIHSEQVTNKKVRLENLSGVLEADGVLIDTLKISKGSEPAYEEGVHYTLSFNSDGLVVINAKKNISGGIVENSELTVSYVRLRPDLVDIYDIIGGYDTQMDENTGLELVSEIYTRFRLVPGQIVAPMFSQDPAVAAVMETKADNIDGHFRCIAVNDMPSMIRDKDDPLKHEYHKYTDIPAWKNNNNYVSGRQINCYPCVRLGEQLFYCSTQMAGLISRTDVENAGVPYASPSNKNMEINGICYSDGKELFLNKEQANYLNGQGIVTAVNSFNGWTAWGNRTGAYPGNTDVKDSFIPVRRMFDWIANKIVLTFWSKVDYPLNSRTIRTIVNSINLWFQGLAEREYILGGRVEFMEDDNNIMDLIDGTVKFRINIAPPPPMEEAQFILTYDPAYLQSLFK